MSDEVVKHFNELIVKYDKEVMRLNNIINKAIEYIEEKCVDDEFYINLSNKEKQIIEVLKILKGETNEKSNI